jgi:hypothetical protein
VDLAKCHVDCAATCNIVTDWNSRVVTVTSVAVLLTLLGEARLLKFGRWSRRSRRG